MSMKMKKSVFANSKTILETADFKARPFTIKADENSEKIFKAGTPLPANDETVLGLLLDDTDITDGDKVVALVFEGQVSTKKLTANGVAIAEVAKKALPRITYFE